MKWQHHTYYHFIVAPAFKSNTLDSYYFERGIIPNAMAPGGFSLNAMGPKGLSPNNEGPLHRLINSFNTY